MTVRATAVVTLSDVSSATFYSVAVHYSAIDDTVTGSPDTHNVGLDVPYSLSSKKADAFIRQSIAAIILSDSGLVVDPDDIYIPFSAR